ncbi:MAG: hypothetical protein ACI4PM_01010 [Butyricicoccus sp.]
MPRILRLIIWDALFFLILSVGYAAGQALNGTALLSYAVSLATCVLFGIFLAQLALWGVGWPELILVGLPALYLALSPFLAPLVNGIAPFPLVPQVLLNSSALSLRLGGALTFGFLLWHRLR